jgi:hypothetical protein
MPYSTFHREKRAPPALMPKDVVSEALSFVELLVGSGRWPFIARRDGEHCRGEKSPAPFGCSPVLEERWGLGSI